MINDFIWKRKTLNSQETNKIYSNNTFSSSFFSCFLILYSFGVTSLPQFNDILKNMKLFSVKKSFPLQLKETNLSSILSCVPGKRIKFIKWRNTFCRCNFLSHSFHFISKFILNHMAIITIIWVRENFNKIKFIYHTIWTDVDEFVFKWIHF